MKGRDLARRLRWFDQGAAALARTRPGLPSPAYACPLCLGLFRREAVEANELTDEHVPPRSIEPRAPRLLTCVVCNSASSSRFDAHLAKAHLMNTWGTPLTAGPLPATLTLGDLQLRGVMANDGNGPHYTLIPKQNDPRDFLRLVKAIIDPDDGEVPTVDLSVVAPHDASAAAMATVRAAYLAAFVLFGYRYILRPALDRVRYMITADDRSVIPLLQDNEGDLSARFIIPSIGEPARLRGAVAVIVGRDRVLLPGTDEVVDVFDAVSSMSTTDPLGALAPDVAGAFPWPDSPTYMHDTGVDRAPTTR